MAARTKLENGVNVLSPQVRRLIAQRDKAYQQLVQAKRTKEDAKFKFFQVHSALAIAGAPQHILASGGSRCW